MIQLVIQNLKNGTVTSVAKSGLKRFFLQKTATFGVYVEFMCLRARACVCVGPVWGCVRARARARARVCVCVFVCVCA